MIGAENKIPEHWEIKTLGDVCHIQTGKYDANHAKPSGKYRFYTCAFEYMLCDTNRFNGESLILPGNGANVGEVFYYNGDFDAYQRTYVLNGIKTLPKFLYYHLLCNWKRKNQDKQFGSATNYIRMANFTDYVVPIPPLIEQQAIVSKIEELLSELENGKKQLQIAQQQLKVYRQSLLKWAFEGKLINKNVKDGELPKGWKKISVKDVCHKIIGGGTPSTRIAEYWNGNIPWITSADIFGIKDIRPRKKITLKAVDNSTTNLLTKGGIIVVTRVSLGRIAIAPFDLCFSQDSQGLILNESLISKEYALWVLHKEVQIFIHQSRGTTIKGVTKKQLEDLQIALPSLQEQQLIVLDLESKLTVCDKIEETISQTLQQAETLRQSVLKKAFEGKLI